MGGYRGIGWSSAAGAALWFAAAVSPASAQSVEPRFAEPVQDRSSAVQPREAPPVEARQAPAVQPRPAAPAVTVHAAPSVRDTSVRGLAPADWPKQRLADTGVAGPGVARGLQLRNIECAGVTCRVFEDSAGDWVIAVEGGFPGAPLSTLEAVTMNLGERSRVESRTKGVFSDGAFRDSVSTWKLAPGAYAVAYGPASGEVYAAVRFDVVRHAAPPAPARGVKPGAGGGTAAADAAARARRTQACLAQAAANPDVICVP